jgi:hypothetical protein
VGASLQWVRVFSGCEFSVGAGRANLMILI